MNKKLTAFNTVFLTFLCIQLFAQTSNFDTGEIPLNWYGNRSDFTINAMGELQLNATVGTTAASLSWPIEVNENIAWEFLIRYDFPASTTNYANFYLMSTTQDVASSTNSAYYLKVGGESGISDKVELIFQTGSSKTTIMSGPTGSVGGNLVAIRFRIYKLMTGEWFMFADNKGGHNFIQINKGTHVSNMQFLFGGIRCLYTSTRRDKFYFDDIKIEEPFTIKKYEFNKKNQLTITFTNQFHILNETQVDIDLGQPYTIHAFENTLEIKTLNPIDPGVYDVQILNIQSIHSDTLISNKFTAQKTNDYYTGQLRITEWMSDPSPTYGLPEIEWVEIINVSDTRIETAYLSLSDPTKKVKLPAYLLKKDSVVVLCSRGGCGQLGIENCIEVDALPNLNNSTDSLFLWANDTILVDYIYYDIMLLANDYRREGGYSIIRATLPQPCFYQQELSYASEQNGGSPGFDSNAVTQTELHTTFGFISDKHVTISLNIIGNIQQQYLSSDIPISSAVSASMQYSTQINASFEEPISPGKAITFKLDSIKTCLNETRYLGAAIQLINPKKAERGMLFINEILYNAYAGGTDFIELYNISEEYIQLKNMHFVYADTKGKVQHTLLKTNQLIAPNSFAVLTTDTTVLKRQYSNTRLENCIQIEGFIPFDDDGGILIMTNEASDTLDDIPFNDDFQNPLNRDDEGISLEKIDLNKTYFTAANWTSSAVGATPGYINSQNLLTTKEGPQPFYCEPCHITTDLNGKNDYVLLHLNPSAAGTFASISIYNLSGELVDKVCVNQLLGKENMFQWNGAQQSNMLLSDGIYLAVAEWWSPNGKVTTSKIAISTSHY